MRRMMTWLGVSAIVALPFAAAGAAPPGRSTGVGQFVLELDGRPAGFLSSVEGGALSAEVVEFAEGGSPIVKKSIGNPKFGDITFRANLDLDPVVYDWIAAMLQGNPQRKDGAIVAADFNFTKRSRLEFREALITEVTFPALDAASKDPAYMTLKLTPEQLEYKPGDGSQAKPPAGKGQRLWLTSNFRFRLGDLPTKRVNKIEALVVKQKVAEVVVGGDRFPQIEPASSGGAIFLNPNDGVPIPHIEPASSGGAIFLNANHRTPIPHIEPTKLEIPNIRLSMSQPDLAPWLGWYEDFVIRGNSGDGFELEGAIEYLDPQGGVLARLDLSHVGIFRLELLPPPSPKPDPLPRFTVELYCEQMSFHHGAVPE